MARPGRKPGTPKTGGRAKGVPNKVTREFRETVRRLLEDNSENVGQWLSDVATGAHGANPDPGKALDLLVKLAEYAAPKLARTEHTGLNGGLIGVAGVSMSADEFTKIAQDVASKV